jgi:hypothetical protein
MKKLFFLSCSLLIVLSSFANSPRNIDEKLLQSFSTSFPHAEKIHWQELSQSYVVSFVDNGILSRVTYQKKDGAMANYFRYYQEEGLPMGIRSDLKHDYEGKKIWGVVEVSTPVINRDGDTDGTLSTLYYVKLEGATNWLTVKIDSNGNSEVVEKLKKAK